METRGFRTNAAHKDDLPFLRQRQSSDDNVDSACCYLCDTFSSSQTTSNSSLDMDKAIRLRSKYKHFRTLIVGRANAGKTTLLKRVCNSIEDPEIFSPSGKRVIESATFERQQFAHLNHHDYLQLDPAVVQESSEV